MSALGERVVTRYIKHPPAASQWWQDADPFDSGGAFIADSNTTHLAVEAVRPLVGTMGPGSVPGYQTANSPWSGLLDATEPETGSAWGGATVSSIPWDRRTAVRCGPYHLICDRDLASGELTARTVRMRIQATIDAAITTQTALFALTTSEDPQALVEGNYLAFATNSFGGTALRTVTKDLIVGAPIAPALAQPWRSRSTSAAGDGSVYVVPAWLWFGWLFRGSSNTSTIDALSAWELRA